MVFERNIGVCVCVCVFTVSMACLEAVCSRISIECCREYQSNVAENNKSNVAENINRVCLLFSRLSPWTDTTIFF